ncbi:pyridoxal-phosphate dependent enzyme [Candidatus Dojkabacteria bacterium]|nr:pyridoxal-phosphate dependent enzyme [Candidatus Dojkabacteria bacterium]
MGIWQYSKYLKPKVKDLFRLTLKEGNTPCKECAKLARVLNIEKIYLKREDLNPTGSFKDRSLAFQLSVHFQEGREEFVISSTGNAAISAISYAKLFKCKLHVFVSKNIPADKLLRLLDISNISDFDHSALQKEETYELQKDNLKLYFSARPKSDSVKFSNAYNIIHLRGSNDDLATIGYKTISYELVQEIKATDAIIIACSSGTSTVGIYQGFVDLGMTPPPIHIVQTTKVNTMASNFDRDFKKSDTSLASAISDRVALRKDQIIGIVSRTGGSGWVIDDEEIMTCQMLLAQNCEITTSFDSSLTLAGLIKALKNDWQILRPVLILSGQ